MMKYHKAAWVEDEGELFYRNVFVGHGRDAGAVGSYRIYYNMRLIYTMGIRSHSFSRKIMINMVWKHAYKQRAVGWNGVEE